tara:strand:+ start:1774 stop:2817 length:1044 start_codon:yes stop_codon:yes gene_type:complete
MSEVKKIGNLIDLLDEDKPIGNQKFACVSFVSPENNIKLREHFFFQEFIKNWDVKHNFEKFTEFMNFLSYKYNLNFDNVVKDLDEFVKSEKDKLEVTNISDDYKTFVDNNEEQLETEFKEKHTFETSVRGVKIRGCFPTQQEAELRCRMLREVDPNHDVYVGPVGLWMPWEPEAYKTGRVEYLEDELNKLMHEKKKNEEGAKEAFDKRVKETKEKAIQDNIEKAKQSGNKLSQTINEEGNLINVANVTSSDSLLNKQDGNVSVDDIHKELFEGDNIVTNEELKNSDHGLSAVLESEKNRNKSNNEINPYTNIENVENNNDNGASASAGAGGSAGGNKDEDEDGEILD